GAARGGARPGAAITPRHPHRRDVRRHLPAVAPRPRRDRRRGAPPRAARARAGASGARPKGLTMDDQHPATRDPAEFREIVRNPRAHAVILGQYRIGEYAGVVALQRLLGEMRPEGKLHEAMTIHHRDEARHSQVFTDWMRRLGVEPPPLPTEVEGYFSN